MNKVRASWGKVMNRTHFEDREKNVFLVQLTTSRIGNLTRLILTLAILVLDHHTYIDDAYQGLRNCSVKTFRVINMCALELVGVSPGVFGIL